VIGGEIVIYGSFTEGHLYVIGKSRLILDKFSLNKILR
jgi:hypothetical protein